VRFGRPAWAAAFVVAYTSATLRPVAAQTGATVDLGVTNVRYDGFLPSSAASASGELRLERARVVAWTRGTYLQFESGRHSMQGNIAGSLFSGPWRGLRAELSGHTGLSQYADFATYSHLLAAPRVHFASERTGAWAGGTAGTTWLGGARRPASGVEAGAWARRLGITWLISATNTHVGDTAYTDFQGASHIGRGRFSFDGSLGVRAWSRGGGHGVYGEASGGVALNPWLSVIVSGGRYPTDPTRGSVAGRYLGVSLRMAALPHHSSFTVPVRPAAPRLQSAPLDPPAASIELRPCRCSGVTLAIHAPGAGQVEVAGDFSNWEAVVLSRADSEVWIVELPLSRGTYRFNVRIDGGEWIVPVGVTGLTDEFGGAVGLLRVP
jgi:predicted carbohydrate-binding protein with CBM48